MLPLGRLAQLTGRPGGKRYAWAPNKGIVVCQERARSARLGLVYTDRSGDHKCDVAIALMEGMPEFTVNERRTVLRLFWA